jgi:25S rRNA (uracil2634-N3)-methyltransferase
MTMASGHGADVAIIYGIDATKLSSTHKKALRPYSPFTKIVFNFPHVGGLSTDINRQVRYNQELLVGFFKAAKGLLSSPDRPASVKSASDHYGSEPEAMSEGSEDSPQRDHGAINGQILVTLFEGEPYTLWNIRDLARHSGLKVVESFKFPWAAYPGYHHARTIGDITSGKDRSDEGKRRGAWRGEERDARCYVLEHQDASLAIGASSKRKRKRQNDLGDSD